MELLWSELKSAVDWLYRLSDKNKYHTDLKNFVINYMIIVWWHLVVLVLTPEVDAVSCLALDGIFTERISRWKVHIVPLSIRRKSRYASKKDPRAHKYGPGFAYI